MNDKDLFDLATENEKEKLFNKELSKIVKILEQRKLDTFIEKHKVHSISVDGELVYAKLVIK